MLVANPENGATWYFQATPWHKRDDQDLAHHVDDDEQTGKNKHEVDLEPKCDVTDFVLLRK